MRAPSLTIGEKHLVELLEPMARRTGDRVRYVSLLDAVDWDDFRYPEIMVAFEGLVKKKRIARDEVFVTRLW